MADQFTKVGLGSNFLKHVSILTIFALQTLLIFLLLGFIG